MTPPLPGLASRGRTYAFMAGVVSTLLLLAVGIPLTLGERPQAAGSSETLAFEDGAAPLDGAAPGAAPLDGPDGGPLPGTPRDGTAPLGGPADLPGAAADGSAPGADAGAQPGAAPAPGDPASGTGTGSGTGSGTADGGAAAGAGRPAAPRTTARTASDQGLTADTVRVGIFLIAFGRANDLGAGVEGYDVDVQRRFAQAYVDEVNAAGGIGGRRVVPVFREVDILSQQTMRDACTSFGQTDRVFAVAQVLGVYGDPILVCAQQQRLPFLATDGAASGYYAQSRNYVITTQPSTLRTNLNMAKELVRTGELRGKKVGVVYYDGYLLADNQRLLQQLRRDGVDVVEGRLSLQTQEALRQLPLLARDFCSKGVDVILLGTNALFGRQFVENVDRNPGCAPAYAVSDFDYALAGDSFVTDMPDSFFRRALAVTASRHGEGRVGLREAPVDALCRGIAERRLRTRIDRNRADRADYFNALSICGVLSVLKQGMEAAGPNPTRASFVSAVQRLGSVENPGFGPSSFAPGRTDSTEAVRITQAFLDCRCWKPRTGFVTAPVR